MIRFSVAGMNPATRRTGCLVAGVHEGRQLTEAARRIDEAAGGAVARVLADGDLGPSVGATTLMHRPGGVPAGRVLLVRLGPRAGIEERDFRKAARAAASALKGTGARSAADFLTEAEVEGRDCAWKVRQLVDAHADASYRFDEFKSDRDKRPAPRLESVALHVGGERDAASRALDEGVAISAGKDLARDLGNRPGNVCTPSHLASCAADLGECFDTVTVDVLDEARMRDLGMGALLGVARGSREPPRLIDLRYSGADDDRAPVVLVGKGVTFDSGGISLKPAGEMDEMKFDMCGAASVLGTIRAVAELALPLNVVGLVPAVENLPDGNAVKPGDILTSMSGQTIEVLNTDAEGRLILCDALTYAERVEPAAVIDIATLTGACIIALGHAATGMFTNCRELGDALLDAGARTGDRCWELPVWPEYAERLESNFADVANVGGRPAGSITAASFLARFVREQRWAHLDIAGTAWQSGKSKGATGRPVPLLVQYLLDRTGS